MNKPDVLALAGAYLKDVAGLKFEWYLKITPAGVTPRPAALFWVVNYHGGDISKEYARLHALLLELNCPAAIVAKASTLATVSNAQGVLVPLEEGARKHTLYLHYNDARTNGEERIALSWQGNARLEPHAYAFHLFPNGNLPNDVLRQTHAHHRELLRELLSEAPLRKMGYYYQHKGGNIDEVYVAYPWQPAFRTIATQLMRHFPAVGPADFHAYGDHYFRHVGFSSPAAPVPAVTLYFSAGFRGDWPLDLEALQHRVKVEGEILNRKLSHALGTT
ncbi:MAG: hypothetical protein ICV83_05055 [Cytophagales bacterium]|nr:hypothetical protein [Cytophagales bacterium]